MGGSSASDPDWAVPLLSVEQVAARLAVPRSWVYKQAQTRRIAYYKVGHYLRFDPADIDA